MRYNLLLKKVGRNIKRIRKQKKMSQFDLAESCNIYQNRISIIENGKGNPTLKILNRMANIFNVDIIEFFK